MVAIANSPENAPPLKQATPKTHTPEWRMQELGYRYYSPKLGRWVSRGKRRETGMEQEVKVRHSEGLASHTGPELCVGDW